MGVGGLRDETVLLLMRGVHLSILVCKFTYIPFDRQWEKVTRARDGDGSGGPGKDVTLAAYYVG
jgi:hypothetical protein